MRVVVLTGVNGSGKTTVVRELLKRRSCRQFSWNGFKLTSIEDRVAVFGHYGRGF